MTVICALLTRDCVVHSSDSFLTQIQTNGTLSVVESRRPKIVAIRHFRGAISFCGVGGIGRMSMLDWLTTRAQQARNFTSPDQFANWLADTLDLWLQSIPLRNRGVGLHFTVYETFSFGDIPEMFWITNWDGAFRVLPNVTSQRQTIITATRAQQIPAGSQPDQNERRFVQRSLQQPFNFFRYNQGDPMLFNRQANAIVDSALVLQQRGVLIPDRTEYAGRLALMPIEAVCNMQRWLSRRGTRAVGGRPHNLIITPQGQYSSNTGLRLIPGT